MSKNSDGDKLEELHNKGQEDGAKDWGSYDRPHGALSTLFTETERKCEENKAYDEGFRHARDQKR